jgi:predicted nucleic acid-binding protein
MYLLDTNVVSEFRKNKPHGGVVAWIQGISDEEIFLSSLTLGELQAGIELTRRHDSVKAGQIEVWLDQVADSYQILPMDGRLFREWARLMVGRPDQLLEDALLAATARIHRLTVVTRNTKDFQLFEVPVFDPFRGK